MNRKNTFTPSTIEALTSGRLADPLTPGLAVEMVRGSPVWQYRRRIAGTTITFKRTLGPYLIYSIGDARAWAADLNEQVTRGLDPRRVESDSASYNAMTVTAAHEKYMIAVREGRGSRAKQINKPRTIAAKQELFRAEIEPAIGRKLIFDVTESDLTRMVIEVGKRAKYQANRLAGELKVFFGWASSLRGSEVGLAVNPAVRLADLRFPETPRNRSLSLDEIALFLRALVPEPRVYQRAMLLWLLTAARLKEVIDALASEVEDGVWTIPEDRAKNRRAHRVALGPWGESLMQSATVYVFPSDRIDGPRCKTGFYDAKKRILAAMAVLAGRPIENWTPHDLRRTARSNTKRLDVDFETAEAMLNHAKTGLERTYDGYALDEEKREWFYRWEAEIARIATEAGVAESLGLPQAVPVAISPALPRRWDRRRPVAARLSRSRLARRHA